MHSAVVFLLNGLHESHYIFYDFVLVALSVWQDVKCFLSSTVRAPMLDLCALVGEFSSRKLLFQGWASPRPLLFFISSSTRRWTVSVSASSKLARALTRAAHNFLPFPSFVWYTPFIHCCFFIPDEGMKKQPNFIWLSSGTASVFAWFFFFFFLNRHHSSSAFKFVYETQSNKKKNYPNIYIILLWGFIGCTERWLPPLVLILL